MSKKELENTDEGKELIDIEQLSQDLENLFKEMEQVRRENFLFESYLMRLEKEHKKDDEEDKKKTTKGTKKKEQKKVMLLTPEEKYEIAQLEAQALRQNIQKGKLKSDAILQTLRAILEETDMSIAEIRKDAYDFQREILLGGENNRTGKIQAQRIQKYFEQKERQKKSLIEKYKNKRDTLAAKIKKTAIQIDKKEEMGDELKFIDFHQLQIENKKYVKEIEQKNQKLLQYKIDSGKIGSQLLEAKRELNNDVSFITKCQKEISDKEKTIKDLERNYEEIQVKKRKLTQKKRKLNTQAEQMKSPTNSDIPNTMAYVTEKRLLEKYMYQKKNLERKINIAQAIYEKAKNALEQG